MRALSMIAIATVGLMACSTEAENRQSAFVSDASVAGKIQSRIEQMVAENELDGAAVIIRKNGDTIYSTTVGSYTLDTRVQLASATKWITAATALTVVDQDGMSLDAPVADYVANVPADKTAITSRQMMSHTSGLPGDHALKSSTKQKMSAAVEDLLKLDLAAAPGTEVIYGGVSLQVAGFAATQVAGKAWRELFDERIAGPLNWTDEVVWDHPIRPASIRKVRNPNLGAGLHMTAREYIGFLDMLAAGGTSRGKVVLSPASIAAMFTDNTKGLGRSHLPRTASNNWGYGLGCWCQVMTEDGDCRVMNSAGAFGTFPWLDRDSGVYGVIVVKTRLPKVLDDVLAIQAMSNQL